MIQTYEVVEIAKKHNSYNESFFSWLKIERNEISKQLPNFFYLENQWKKTFH